MKIVFIIDPIESFKIYKDSTYAMMREAAHRGHELNYCLLDDIYLEQGKVRVNVTSFVMTGEEVDWYVVGKARVLGLEEFDAIIMRKDPPFDMEYVYATYLLEIAETQGAHILNRPGAIRSHSEKLSIGQFPELTSPTLVSRNMARLREFHRQYGDVILKPLDGMGGMGIFRVGGDGLNLGSILEMLTADGTRTIMMQKYIPEITKGDKRILLINGEPVPFALARIPAEGEVRGNLAAGGTGVAQPLTEKDRSIVNALADTLIARGLFLVGLDVIGNYLTEINVTSPTCFQEITEQTGFNVAAMFMDAVELSIGKSIV